MPVHRAAPFQKSKKSRRKQIVCGGSWHVKENRQGRGRAGLVPGCTCIKIEKKQMLYENNS